MKSLAISIALALAFILCWSCLAQPPRSTLPERQRAYDLVVEQDIARGPVAVDVQTEQSTPVAEPVDRLVITPEASP